MKVGDLVRHIKDDSSMYSGKLGIIVKIGGPQYSDITAMDYPDILWEGSFMGTAYIEYLEVISEQSD